MDEFFEKARDGFQKTVETISKKSGEILAVSKCKSQISIAKEGLSKNYEEIGRYIYAAFAEGNEFDNFINTKCERIEGLQKEINELEEKLAELKNIKECPACGNECDFEAIYCSKCGYKFYESHKE